VSGETNLSILIRTMRPELQPGVFIFATVPDGTAIPPSLTPLMIFRETEGITLILTREAAEAAGLAVTFRCRMITLAVHSSLEAVGFLATITQALADAGIAVNPVSAFHHDHLFVPEDRAEEALIILERLAGNSRVPAGLPK